VKTYATYNIKGGVGKTTAAVNLAYLSAADGCRTLLWDLDPQGAARQRDRERRRRRELHRLCETNAAPQLLQRFFQHPLDLVPEGLGLFELRFQASEDLVDQRGRGIGLVVVLPGAHEEAPDVLSRVQVPLEELQDSGLPPAPRRVDADRHRVQVSTSDDRRHNVDDIFKAEQVNLARAVVAQRHGRMGDTCVAHRASVGWIGGRRFTSVNPRLARSCLTMLMNGARSMVT